VKTGTLHGIWIGLLLILLLTGPATAATTELHLVRYASDGSTILNETTVTYQWLEANLPVMGDGVTHYYSQGPTFNDTDPYDPAEYQNVLTRDWGAVKGTDLKDLCNLMGGMRYGENVKLRAQDGMTLTYPYEYVYNPNPRQGPMVITWYCGEDNLDGYELQGTGYPPDYYMGMRLVMFADTSINPWGYHVFGDNDMREVWAPQYRYNFSGIWPSSGGVSMKYVSEVMIYSLDPPAGELEIKSLPSGAHITLDGKDTGRVTNATLYGITPGSHSLSILLDGYQPASRDLMVTAGKNEVHFSLVPVSSVSSSDSGTSEGNSGYLGKEFVSIREGVVNGSVFLALTNRTPVSLKSGESTVFPLLAPPSGAGNNSWARLCVFSTGTSETEGGGMAESPFTIAFDDQTLKDGTAYTDRKGEDTLSWVRTDCYNVTTGLTLTQNHTVRVSRQKSETGESIIHGASLFVARNEENGSETAYYLAEGCDAILADSSTGISYKTAASRVEWTSDLFIEEWKGATLSVLVTGLNTSTGEAVDLQFNDQTRSDLFRGGSPGMISRRWNVTEALNRVSNRVILQSGNSSDEGAYLENRLFLLVLSKGNVSEETTETDQGEKEINTTETLPVSVNQSETCPPCSHPTEPEPVPFFEQVLRFFFGGPTTEVAAPLNFSLYCRYSPGTTVAWNLSGWTGKGEYQGEVMGRITGYAESIPGTPIPSSPAPLYVLSLHPFYRSTLESLMPEDANATEQTFLVYHSCSSLDPVTAAWDGWVDWDSTLIRNESGMVIGKSNHTAIYHLEGGEMVKGAIPAAPVVLPDPLEFPDALIPQIRYQYDDEQHENVLSLGMEQARILNTYLCVYKNGTTEEVIPRNGSTFLLVYLEVYHLGHKAYTYNYEEYTPEESAFRVYYAGYNYTPLLVPGDIASGTYQWKPYTKTLLDRYEHMDGALLFEVPDDIALSHAYLRAGLGEGRMPIWRLA
jgi:hypothetical protein